MPKQIFQRPAPIKHSKIGKQNQPPFGPGSKGTKLPKAAKPNPKAAKPKK